MPIVIAAAASAAGISFSARTLRSVLLGSRFPAHGRDCKHVQAMYRINRGQSPVG
jgi:hypothetical protein